MAKMIPPQISSQTESPGEHEIFRRLRDAPETEGWVVLHSLDLAKHKTQTTGEIDFGMILGTMAGAGFLFTKDQNASHSK